MTTSHLLMIRPAAFGYNPETAVNNTFQQAGTGNIQEKALKEFDDFVALLRSHHIDVTVVEDTPEPPTPDSIFPNNWFSTHKNGTLCFYPMFAENRRRERKSTVIDIIKHQFDVRTTVDFTDYENTGQFLEGTGSMVLDRDNHIAYACLSPRTDQSVLADFCGRMNYAACCFDASDSNGIAVYHTNVMMCVGERCVIVCLESVNNPAQREMLADTIENTGKALIPISLQQMAQFAGNMLEVENKQHDHFMVMSDTAYRSLTKEQIHKITQHTAILHPALTTIETNGGGSARCMMAEIYLNKK